MVFFNAGTGAPKPEEAEQTEGGLKFALPSGFASTLSPSPSRGATWCRCCRAIRAFPPDGAQRSQGFDVDLTWQPLPGLSMLASYAHSMPS